jgi:steroid delta-isomerase-like uncharacterized protein
MFASIRRYTIDPQKSNELVRRVDTGFLPLVRKIDGFLGYYLVLGKDGATASVNVFRTAEGAAESNRRAAGWVSESVAPLLMSGPEITEGEVALHAEAEGGAGHLDLARVEMQDATTLVRSVFDAINQRDIERGAGLHADDAELVDVPAGQTRRGPEGFRQSMNYWLTAFPDGRVEIERLVVQNDTATVEYIGRGTQTGPLAAPTGEIPASGRKVELRFCDVVRLRGGKIAAVHSYYDAATMLQQLGLIQHGVSA